MKICRHLEPRNNSVLAPSHLVCNSPPVYNTLTNNWPALNALIPGVPAETIRLAPEYDSILRIIFYYGLRSVELLSGQVSDVVRPDTLYVHGAKGSRDTLVYIPGLTEHSRKCIATSTCPYLFHISYIDLWRSCKRAGIYVQVKERMNLSVTHAGRRFVAQDAHDMAGQAGITDILRHRSKRSQLYYNPTRSVRNG